jgi:hypothetical protein
MNKFECAAAVSALAFTAAASTTASAAVALRPPVVVAGSNSAGAAAVGGFISFETAAMRSSFFYANFYADSDVQGAGSDMQSVAP